MCSPHTPVQSLRITGDVVIAPTCAPPRRRSELSFSIEWNGFTDDAAMCIPRSPGALDPPPSPRRMPPKGLTTGILRNNMQSDVRSVGRGLPVHALQRMMN